MKRLYRSETDKKLAGVCGGIGEVFNIDPVVVRIIFLILLIGTGFFPFGLGYLLAIWLIPKKSDVHNP